MKSEDGGTGEGGAVDPYQSLVSTTPGWMERALKMPVWQRKCMNIKASERLDAKITRRI